MTEAADRRDLASTLAELYRADVDATGQPMSPDPFHAVKNAIEHYSIDEVLISTFAGESSRWLEDDLIGKVREITDKPSSTSRSAGPPPPSPRRSPRVRRGSDGERDGRPGPRPRGASRAAGGQRELADRPPDARDPALHRLRGDALRRLLRRLLLPPRRRRPAGLAAGALRAAGQRGAGSTPASWSPRASRSTTRWRRSAGATGRASSSASCSPGCSAQPSSSSRSTSTSTSASAPATSASARSSTASPACTALTSSSGSCCSASPRSAPSAATSAPRQRTTSASRCQGIYWHFVDVMWIIVFLTVYIL